MTTTSKHTIVILNLSNLTGVLNHTLEVAPGQYEPIRVDYKMLLDKVSSGVTPNRAVAISQRDPRIHKNMDNHHKFLRGLKAFGWDSTEVLFNAETRDITNIRDAIMTAVYEGNITDDGNGNTVLVDTFDPTNTDLIFISGTQLWEPVIEELQVHYGFNCMVAFPGQSLHSSCAKYPFLDLDPFIQEQHQYMQYRKDLKKVKDQKGSK